MNILLISNNQKFYFKKRNKNLKLFVYSAQIGRGHQKKNIFSMFIFNVEANINRFIDDYISNCFFNVNYYQCERGFMKKLITAVAVAASLLSAASMNANANTGTIRFTGAISASTCDFNVAVDGVVTPTGVVDLGVYPKTEATAIGLFGTQKNVSLVPDAATCTPDLATVGSDTDHPDGLAAMVKIDASQVDVTNTDVVTSPETLTTNVGVQFKLASGQSVVNAGAVTLDTANGDFDKVSGAINFIAQPYALATAINGGIIGGEVSYTVAYL
ncbi:fimbrial protein [Rahnella laticis]|uniref:fimbrial protein n=1 Tax=Rahnella laticis TaxID=2787622 RepID=UPI0018A268DF|nr:fimbrial protein [Rahnella laticis]MBF7993693.1 type 1 fimbrial protein [Rahnella laticis]